MQALEKAREVLNHWKRREIPKEEYLSRLSKIDRRRITGLIEAFRERIQDFHGETVGIIVVGSSVRPKNKRSHPVQDVDLRILTSVFSMLPEMKKTLIDATVEVTREFAGKEGEFDYIPNLTKSIIPVEAISGWAEEKTKKVIVPFLDYSNNDPSFVIKGQEGSLPLHISISADPEDSIENHLMEERRQNQYFSVLALIAPNS